ncbi:MULTISPECIES: hypothetical protein [Streptomyces]|uniref:hypothetical protein n=1 Tax=Streptomyces TaxID=1883 RepID=UPI000B9E539E|nr:hypothetical protein [Streptomyces kasugaensis]
MSDEHHSADDTAPHPLPCDEERRLARKALAGRARDADDLSLLMDMLGLDPDRDMRHEAVPGRPRGRAPGRTRRSGPRRGACRDVRSRPADPG